MTNYRYTNTIIMPWHYKNNKVCIGFDDCISKILPLKKFFSTLKNIKLWKIQNFMFKIITD